jgi:excinuclease ABC subunit C
MRDVTRGLESIAREQRVHRLSGGDQDVVAVARDGKLAAGAVLRIRRGVLLGRDTLRFSGVGEETDADLLGAVATRFYLGRGEEGAVDLPREILVAENFTDRDLMQDILNDQAGRKVRIRVPQRGEKLRLIELAGSNARSSLEERVTALAYAADRADETLYELQSRLDLKVVPRLMACFDVSHLQGAETVASAVVFENGTPKKAEYRHMRIRGDWGNDDYRSMAEVVLRYFRRRVDEEKPLPDLVIIDGGRGQLNAALEALKAIDLSHVAVGSLAKKEEEVFLPGRRDPIRLSRRDPALHLLQRLRDEAHRFAVTYNRKLRSKRTLRSQLEDIPGIGPLRQKALLEHFGSVKAIREARPDQVANLPGFSETLSLRIQTYLKG